MPNPVFYCQICDQPLNDIPLAGVLTAVCPRCQIRYQIIRGRLIEADPIRMLGAESRSPGQPRGTARYRLLVELPSGHVETVAFHSVESGAPIIARAGDTITAVYLMRGEERDQLLSVHNEKTGGSRQVARAVRPGKYKAWGVASGLGAAAVVLGAGLFGSVLVGSGIGLVVFLGAGPLMSRALLPRVVLSPADRAKLEGMQRLLADKLRLDAEFTRAERELASNQSVREKLVSLRSKMERVGAELYAVRIASIDAAIATIDEQMALQTKLRAGYERSVQMLEIELEAGATVDAMEPAAAPHLTSLLEELQALEQEQAELRRQLDANAEVEGLLRGVRS